MCWLIKTMPSITKFYHKFFLINHIFINDLRDLKNLVQNFLTYILFDKVINISDLKILNNLFICIAYHTSFHHIVYNGLPYYEKTNTHQFTDIKIRPKYDIDSVCDYYDNDREDIDDCGVSIYPSSKDKIKYILKYHRKWDSYLEYNMPPDNIELTKQIIKTNFKKILLIGYKSLVLNNKKGINYDHRGSNHCNVYLEFYPTVFTDKIISLNILAKYFYKLKSHKWDKWYEMFCDTDIKVDKERNIIVDFRYDHGS